MSQLRTNVRLAIIDAVAKVPGVTLDGNWQGIAGALRDRLYGEIAERLVQRDRGTVAASLLAALQEGQVGPEDWKAMLFSWAAERLQDNEKLSLLAAGLDDGKLSHEEVIAALAAWARSRVDDEAALTLLATIEDGRLEGGELKAALLQAAASLAGDSDVAKALSAALADGSFSRSEALAVITAWGQRQIRDETLRALFASLATGQFDRDQALAVLTRVLAGRSGLDPEVVQKVLLAVRSGSLEAKDVLLILSTWAAAAGHEDVAQLADLAQKVGGGDAMEVAAALLQQGFPKRAAALLARLPDSDWLSVVAVVLGTLELGLGGRMLSGLLGGRLREAAVKELTKLLAQAGLQQAGVVAGAVVDIATGARSLFAEGEESDSGLQNPVEIALWREVRQVIYLAQLATFGGTLVPTGAQSEPHIFQAAAIRFRTPLHELVPTGTGDGAKKLFANTVTAFLDRQFGPRMRRRFQDEPVLAFDLNDLKPEAVSSARGLFVKVQTRLLPAA